jgi:DNA repair protein RecO
MIVKTSAIALRLDPYSKTSQVVSWLTPSHGRVVTLAKGSKRRQSEHLGQYDLYYTCEVLFYANPRSTIHVLKECCPLRSREHLRPDWRACMGASYLADLLNRLTPAGVANARLFSFAEHTLDFLNHYGINAGVIHWAELKLFHLLGVGPQFSTCIACGAKSASSSRPALFSISRGGVVCPACRSERDLCVQDVSHDVLTMLKTWMGAESPLIALRTVCSPPQAEIIDRLLGGFLVYHLESSFRARQIVLESI